MELTQREIELLLGTKLFRGIGSDKLLEMLTCLYARRKSYGPGETVVEEGAEVTEVGIVLSGHARSLTRSASGDPLIISLLEQGSFIGVLLAASRNRKSPVTVEAKEPLSVLFFPAEKLISACEKNCPAHADLLRNYLDSVAEKSLTLNDRIDCLIRRGVREKIMTYLALVSDEKGVCARDGAREFAIPLDRNGLADYLNIERSALSRELSRMKRDGLIEYHKNFFRICAK